LCTATGQDPRTLKLTEDEEAQVLSRAELQKRVNAVAWTAWTDAGHTVFDGEREVPDIPTLRAAIAARLVEQPVFTREERNQHAWTKNGLTAAMFPTVPAPGTEEYEDGGEIAKLVWKALSGDVLRQCQTRHDSPIQKLIGKHGDCNLVLCAADVPVSTGMKATTERAFYVTDDETLLLRDYAKPLRDAVNKAASDMAKSLGMISERNPALAERLARKIENGMKAASKTARDTLALMRGEDE
jgi:hypothetical protein